MLDVKSLRQSNTDSGTADEASDLVNVFFLNSIRKEGQSQFPFMWKGHYTFIFFSQGYSKSQGLCHNIVSRNFDHTGNSSRIIPVHNIEEIMHIRLVEQEIVSALVLEQEKCMSED